MRARYLARVAREPGFYLEANRAYRATGAGKAANKRYKNTSNGLAIRRTKQSRRRTRLRGSHTAADLKLIRKHQSGLCFYCDELLAVTGEHTDHFVPLAQGGLNSRCNIVIACPTCNREKSDKCPAEFMGELGRFPLFFWEYPWSTGFHTPGSPGARVRYLKSFVTSTWPCAMLSAYGSYVSDG